jgi:hypothetical protein
LSVVIVLRGKMYLHGAVAIAWHVVLIKMLRRQSGVPAPGTVVWAAGRWGAPTAVTPGAG